MNVQEVQPRPFTHSSHCQLQKKHQMKTKQNKKPFQVILNTGIY